MSDRVGVEITGTRLRAVALAAWGDRPRAHAEVDWDPAHPAASVGALAGRMGRVGRIALAIGVDYLHVKHVDLPPAVPAIRRQMVALEPDRFFPVQDERVIVGLEGSVAFAIDQTTLDRWIQAFETWAPVESIEAAPVALARVLGRAGDASYVFPLGDGAARRRRDSQWEAVVRSQRVGPVSRSGAHRLASRADRPRCPAGCAGRVGRRSRARRQSRDA